MPAERISRISTREADNARTIGTPPGGTVLAPEGLGKAGGKEMGEIAKARVSSAARRSNLERRGIRDLSRSILGLAAARRVWRHE